MSKPIAVVFSDLHLHDWKQFNENGRRTDLGMLVLYKLANRAKQLKVPILFCGDLFHNDKQLSNYLLELTLPRLVAHYNDPESEMTYAISGNHDLNRFNSEESRASSYVQTMAHITKKLTCIDFKSVGFEKFNLVGIPYLDDNNGLTAILKEKRHELNPKKKNILMIHTILPGAKDNDGRDYTSLVDDIEDVDDYFEGFDLVLCGHIHKPMRIGKKVIQIGASLQYRVSDINAELGYWIIYDDLQAEFIPFTNFPVYKFYTEEAEKTDNFNYWVKVDEFEEKEMEDVTYNSFNSFNKRKDIIKDYCKINNIGKVKESIMLKYLD